MKEGTFKRQNVMSDQSLILLKIGLTEGSLAISLPVIILLTIFWFFWVEPIIYNFLLFLIPCIQFFAITILGSYYFSHTLLSDKRLEIHNGTEAFKAGLITAMGEGFFIVIYGALIELFLYLRYGYDAYTYSVHFFTYLFLTLLVIIIVIQGLMTWGIFRQSTTPDTLFNPLSQTGKIRTFFSGLSYRNLGICLVLVMIVPTILTFGVMRMDLIGAASGQQLSLDLHSLTAERSGPDTILITTFFPDNHYYFGRTNPFIDPAQNKNRFIILLNSWDLSDQPTIDRQRLAITIDPPQGLQYVDGSQVILKGPGIANITPGHLVIIDVNPSRGSTAMKMTMLDMSI